MISILSCYNEELTASCSNGIVGKAGDTTNIQGFQVRSQVSDSSVALEQGDCYSCERVRLYSFANKKRHSRDRKA